MLERTIVPPHPVDLLATLSAVRRGTYDPTCRFVDGTVWRASRTAAGTATLRLVPTSEGIEATVWDPRVVKPLDEALLDEAAGFDLVVTVEDGLREGGIGATIAAALERSTEGTGRTPRVAVQGVPVSYIPHGKPDAILAELALDAPGIAATTRTLLPR